MRPFCLVVAVCLAVPPLAAASDKPAFDDAALRAVHFVEDRQGWAVGDDGVIWHTIDGGTSWDRQASGVRASLRSVQFLDPFVGWVAGREELPGGGSTAVVLYTRDGGVQWRRILVNSLPGMHLVRFVDKKTGYLAGDGSDQFPSGVFATTDGGRSWQPVEGPRAPSWRAGDFTAEGGALGGAWNRLATVRRAKVFAIDMDSLGGRTLCGLQLRGDDGIAVGQGGLVLMSKKSRGSSWDFVDLGLPQGVREQWDFHAVHGVGSHVWAVGRPGSAALHSADHGKTWQVVRTGQPMPLHAVYFRDEAKGWAVGELGTIVGTADGGKTWQVHKRGGQRLAALSVHARQGMVPLDTVVRLGLEDGYLCAGLCVTGPEPASAGLARVGESCRFTEAWRQGGGAVGETLWQFPLSTHLTSATRDALLGAWNRVHGGAAAEQMLSQLVLAIRMYKPEVLLTDHPNGDQAADAVVAEAMREAFRQAADPKAFPTQLTQLGLEVHQPKKLYAVWPKGADAQVRLDLTALSPRLGGSYREASAGPLALLGQGHPPGERAYRLLADNLPDAGSHKWLMQGISLVAGGPARREMLAAQEVEEAALKLARQRANLWAVAEAPASTLTSTDRLLAQIGPTLAEMPQDAGARVAHGLAWQYARKGQWAMARETFLMLAERYPTHPLAVDATRWLLLHQASSEARRRHEMGQFLLVGAVRGGMPVQQATPAEASPSLTQSDQKTERKMGDVKAVQSESERMLAYLTTNDGVRRWYEGCLTLEKKLAGYGPLHANDPGTQFAVQSARRQLGDVKAALDWYRRFVAEQPSGPWRGAAQAELWLANRVGPPPRPVMSVLPCDGRPYLDGKLDDDCWKPARVVKLQNAVGNTAQEYPTEARITHDRDFVYLAVRCGQPAGVKLDKAKARTRDKDMRASDRVSLMLDLDRDYATCFHFQVDATGCVAEDCWGDKTWDPKWFVAVHHEATGWTLEAAIPRTALTSDHLTPGKAWAANLVRVLPGHGVQAFSLPAEAPEEAMRPEGMGLLMFGQDAQHAATKPAAPAR